MVIIQTKIRICLIIVCFSNNQTLNLSMFKMIDNVKKKAIIEFPNSNGLVKVRILITGFSGSLIARIKIKE